MAAGFSARDVLDYEDGLTLDQLAYFHAQATRLALEREKREVQAMTVALSALFKGDVLQQYMGAIDAAIGSVAASAAPRSAAVDRSIKELGKLQALLD